MMLSRVAERLYWMARYLERAENTARLISVHSLLLMDMPEKMEIDWFTLVKLFNAEDLFAASQQNADEASIMQFLLVDRSNPSSLLGSFASVRENVRTSLDLLPDEIWEQVNQTYLQLQAALPSVGSRHRRQLVLREIMSGCQRIRGVLDSHMSRDASFDFLRIGTYIERADMTSRILEMASLLLSDERSAALRRYEGILWTSLLSALGARQMYMRHKSQRVTGPRVLEFLTADGRFPRSLRYSLKYIEDYLSHLPEPELIQARSKRILEQFAAQDIQHIPVDRIHVVMDGLQAELAGLHTDIASHWFHPEMDLSQMQQQGQT